MVSFSNLSLSKVYSEPLACPNVWRAGRFFNFITRQQHRGISMSWRAGMSSRTSSCRPEGPCCSKVDNFGIKLMVGHFAISSC